ncbi:ABC transporter permease [Bacillus testis]|uniref:ABC transporter permease n=1 Tax=Bacillus testis TaxID=1622072 RepID=UPI000A640213|nr:ABC transporter permease [Bacillus testis]
MASDPLGKSKRSFVQIIDYTFRRMMAAPPYKQFLLLLGAPLFLIVLLYYLYQRKKDGYSEQESKLKQSLIASGQLDQFKKDFTDQLIRKRQFFGKQIDDGEIAKEAEKLAQCKLEAYVSELAVEVIRKETGKNKMSFEDAFSVLIEKKWFFCLSFIPGLFMYLLLFLYMNPYVKYIMERLVMTVFVVVGVSILVFTILYISPFNPAANILGETATKEQIAAFNALHGLDQPYYIQLWNTIKGIFTFDLGSSFAGNEDVISTILRKFPITLTITVWSLLLAVVIALPSGVVSAVRRNSIFDHSFMLIALLGLSIPSFWQGLIFILGFSVNLEWLPATYNSHNWLSLIMPVVVLGTGLTAAVARMTRSSTLEVIHEDYMLTARAKGLSSRRVVMRHAVPNALIPIITVIGLQFGGMLGGAAVTEKVFNISGLGSYIVDKQFIPDVPAVMGAVIYTAIIISVVNMMIDILYAFFDPRIRHKMKQY